MTVDQEDQPNRKSDDRSFLRRVKKHFLTDEYCNV